VPCSSDTEDPGDAERESFYKVASESRQEKGIPLAGKKKIFCLQSGGGKGERVGEKDGPLMQP